MNPEASVKSSEVFIGIDVSQSRLDIAVRPKYVLEFLVAPPQQEVKRIALHQAHRVDEASAK